MKKILIIEDDQIVANIYRNKFSVDGFTVEIAQDGQAGFDMVGTFRPDAVLMDLMLPKLSGVDLMKKLRSSPDFQQLPVIVFSNTYLSNMVQEAWKAGATKCLSKANCTPKQVIDVVRSTLFPNGAANGSSSNTSQIRKKDTTNGNGGRHSNVSPAPASASANDNDKDFLAGLQKSFRQSVPGHLSALRAGLQQMVKAEDLGNRQKASQDLCRRVHALSSNAAIAGMSVVAQICEALEALLQELCENPQTMNASTFRTVATTLDFLGQVFDKGLEKQVTNAVAPSILVVDDDAISRRAVCHALEKARLTCEPVADPLIALGMLGKKNYNLIFLDVDMPEMNGFELCTKLRALPAHAKTPVVFVTNLNDFESRANSTMSGGNDFIAKPFVFIELALKALIFIAKGRMAAMVSK